MPRANIIAREHNLSRLEKHILRGTSNQYELAAAFGVSQPSISGWIKELHRRWKKESPEDTTTQRLIRVKQLDAIAVMALN